MIREYLQFYNLIFSQFFKGLFTILLLLAFALHATEVLADGTNQSNGNDKRSVEKPNLTVPEVNLPKGLMQSTYEFFTKILKHQNIHIKLNNIYNENIPQHANLYSYRLLYTNGEIETTKVEKVSDGLQKETSTAVAQEAKTQVEFLKKLTEGMKFDFDVANLWSSSSKSNNDSHNGDHLKYGLILKDIKVDRDQNGEMKTSPVYEVGPKDTSSEEVQKVSLTKTDAPKKTTKYPSTRFKGHIAPKEVENSVTSSSNSKLPQIDFNFGQEQELYTLNVPLIASKENREISHRFKVPVHQQLAVSKTYNKDMEEKESTVHNVLVTDRAPAMDIKYSHIDKRYSSEIRKSGQGYEVKFTAQMPSGWNPDDGGAKKDTKYQIEYSKSI